MTTGTASALVSCRLRCSVVFSGDWSCSAVQSVDKCGVHEGAKTTGRKKQASLRTKRLYLRGMLQTERGERERERRKQSDLRAGERTGNRDAQSGRVGSTDTWSTVPHRLVCDGEVAKVVADHFGLDLDGVEHLQCKKRPNRSEVRRRVRGPGAPPTD